MLSRTAYKKSYSKFFFGAYILFLFEVACNSSPGKSGTETLFQLLPASETGIDFNNKVVDTKEMNIFNYHNFIEVGLDTVFQF